MNQKHKVVFKLLDSRSKITKHTDGIMKLQRETK